MLFERYILVLKKYRLQLDFDSILFEIEILVFINTFSDPLTSVEFPLIL